jgi:hypothetical protein
MTTTVFTVVLIVATVCNIVVPGALLVQLHRLRTQLAAVSTSSSLTMVMERELTANQVALRVMQDAVEAKRVIGVDVLAETYSAIDLLQAQTLRLSEEIRERRRVEEMAKRRWAERPSDTATDGDTPPPV